MNLATETLGSIGKLFQTNYFEPGISSIELVLSAFEVFNLPTMCKIRLTSDF